jgi:RNA polymerase sigma-70 factor (ECF subfamily)
MSRSKDGDALAFALLVRRHRKRMENFLFRLFWDREKAEDGAQEVFIRLWLSRARYEPIARFTTFLYQFAHRYWLDECRKAKSRPQIANRCGENDEVILVSPQGSDPQRQLLMNYRQRQIQEAILRLPEPQRAAFALVHLEERKISEAALILGIPEGTVKSRLHAAIRTLRRRLKYEGTEEAL